MSSRAALLGLFPTFTASATGGIQFSGRLAWEGVSHHLTAQGGTAHLFSFGPPADAWQAGRGATTKGRAMTVALRWHPPAQTILVWHSGLLKLVPFFRRPRARLVLFLHGIEVWREQDVLTRLLLRRVALFLSNSQHTWERFLTFHPTLAGAPHQVVPLGVGDPLPPAPPPNMPPAALMVSRLERSEDYKGHREVIAAWPQVLTQRPDARLWIAGTGDLRPELEQMVQARGLGEQVEFLGSIPDNEKEARLARCHALVMPSRGEGFGLVYLEAMRHGRPCLVSTLDAGREVVAPPEAGLAADPTDPHALSTALVRLLTRDEQWAQWERAARERYARHFTASHFQQRLLTALFPSDPTHPFSPQPCESSMSFPR